MAIKVKVLAIDQITTTSPKLLYSPATTAPAQTAIVKAIRFANLSGVIASLSLYFVPNGGTAPASLASPGGGKLISPKATSVPVGALLVEDNEVTLGAGDSIYAIADAPGGGSNWFEYVVSGIERDA